MLNSRQESFARYIAEGLTQTEAYRKAYPNNHSADKTIWGRASNLAASPNVKARIDELRARLAEESIMTAQERLIWLSNIIKSDEETTIDKLRANDQMNKLQGLYVTKVEADVKGEIEIKVELTD